MTIAPRSSLAHVHRVTTRVGGAQRDVFVFDHHRQAFTLWADAAREQGPLTLVTLDRHMDLETPSAPIPQIARPLDELDHFARVSLSPRNDDHVVAALEARALGDAVIIARSHAPESLARFQPFRDRQGGVHRFAFARTLDDVTNEVLELIRDAERIALDIDLDCFSTLSDAHPDEVLPWDAEHIEGFLRPPDCERFWQPVLAKTTLITLAREPYHCGGLSRGARLWADFAEVFFTRLLGVPAP